MRMIFSPNRFSAAFLLLLAFSLAGSKVFAQAPLELKVPQNNAASLLQILNELTEIRKQGESKPAVISIPAGKYHFEQTVQLTPELVGKGLTLIARQDNQNKPTLSGADGVVFSGGVPLANGKQDAKGNWRFTLPANWDTTIAPRTVLINSKMHSAARYPNEGYLRIEKANKDRRSGFITKSGDIPKAIEGTNEVCDLIFLHDWSSSRLPVKNYDSKTRTLNTVGSIGHPAKHYAIDHFEKHPRYWLEGHPSFADLPGEWYFDRKANQIVVVSSPEEKNPPQVILPRLSEILVAAGAENAPLKNLTLQGITFSGSKFAMPINGLVASQATAHQARLLNSRGDPVVNTRTMLPAAVKIERAENCKVQNCKFQDLGNSGLLIGAQTRNCTVRRCQIIRVGGNGINLGEDSSRRIKGKVWYRVAASQVSTNNKVEKCEISFCGQTLPGAVGIWGGLNAKLAIVNNHIHDTPYTGISLGWVWNNSDSPARDNIIRDNKIEFVMQTLSDGGGIYTLGKQPGSVIENNFISDIPVNLGRAQSNGMFLDEGSTGFTIQGNTIRRVAKSPIRFHRAGENEVTGNQWELATPQTPPVTFNNTKPTLIKIEDNSVLKKQKQIYLIGNSLTMDTLPPMLDERPRWHIDCGKPLKYIYDHPENPCVPNSRIWTVALKTTQFDFISFQPHYGKSIEEDFEVICKWIDMQHKAIFIIHTGWAFSAKVNIEWADKDPQGISTHSKVCLKELLKRLREKYPKREFRSTYAMYYLQQIEQDIQAKKAPFEKLEDIYRDAIHMKVNTGRYLMHNTVRKAIGQPLRSTGFPKADPKIIKYLNELLKKDFSE